MNFCTSFSRATAVGCTLVVWVLGHGVVAHAAAATNTGAPAVSTQAKPTVGMQTVYQSPEPPQSNFTVPSKPAEGRDPFYPRSTLVYGEDPSTKIKTNAPNPVAELALRGISGTDDNPLAIINNVTFGVGDELDISTKAGRMKIRCLKINKDAGTATVQLGGITRELRLNAPPAPTPINTPK